MPSANAQEIGAEILVMYALIDLQPIECAKCSDPNLHLGRCVQALITKCRLNRHFALMPSC